MIFYTIWAVKKGGGMEYSMNKFAAILRESRLARFLIPAGIILIVCGIIFFGAMRKNQDYVKTESTVTKVEVDQEAHTDADGNPVEATYKVSVKYTVGGKEYESELGGVSKFKEGDKMTIYYNPADPSQITQTKSLVIPLVMFAAGIAALAGGIVSIINAVKKMNKMKEQEKEWTNGK